MFAVREGYAKGKERDEMYEATDGLYRTAQYTASVLYPVRYRRVEPRPRLSARRRRSAGEAVSRPCHRRKAATARKLESGLCQFRIASTQR